MSNLSDDEARKLAEEMIVDCYCSDRPEAKLARKLLKVLNRQRWIPVSERLPEDHGLFLCTTESGIVVIHAFEVGVGWKNIRNGDSEYWNKFTTYWMPLPQPPEQQP